MLNSWRQLCRLCAKENGSEIDIFLKCENGASLAQAIQKYFLITINPYEQSPTMICTTCYKSITNLVLFAEHTSKVEAFFTKLMLNEFNLKDTDLNNLKFQHGLSEFVFSFPDVIRKYDQGTDENKNETNRTEPIICTKSYENTKKESITEDENYLEVKDEDTSESEAKSIKKRPTKRTKTVQKKQNLQCDKCKKSCKTEYHFRLHIRKCHSSAEKKICPCDKCGKQFSSRNGLRKHEVIHLPDELKYTHPCLYCEKKFSKSASLQIHIKAIHIGDKSFICEECGKAFKTNGALKEHKYVHVQETPFECQKCLKKFKTMVLLKIHEDTHNDTIYNCPECGLKLNTKRILRRHMVVHSDQKNYKCNHCGNKYKRVKALKDHLIVHTGLKPYTCPFCDKAFADSSNCRKHKKLSHPIEFAAMEASGDVQPTTNIPKISQLRIASTKSE